VLGTPPKFVVSVLAIGGSEDEEIALDEDSFNPPNGVGAFGAIGGYTLEEDWDAPPNGAGALLALAGYDD
jgi:hypothetical protein